MKSARIGKRSTTLFTLGSTAGRYGKHEGLSTDKPKTKARSQFRVKSLDLPALYESSRVVDACEEARR